MGFGIKKKMCNCRLVKAYNMCLKMYTYDDVLICITIQTASKQYQFSCLLVLSIFCCSACIYCHFLKIKVHYQNSFRIIMQLDISQ